MERSSADIRAQRDRSNRAIAARDAELVVTFMMPNVRVQVAGGPMLAGQEASRRAFAEQFADPRFGGYVREPDDITVAADGNRATERGRWNGHWKTRSGTERMRGTYVAEWERTEIGWLISSEEFRE